MDELVKRLREAEQYVPCIISREDAGQAADAIEELQTDNAALNGTIANLIEQIAELSKPRWIPVTERLPEEGGWYLANVFSLGVQWGEITTKDSEWIQLVFYYEGKFHKLTGSNAKVTHWMPLPQPPMEEEGET